ncbi:MAG: chloride channel protein [Proteobacteria bacterium]|nr:chloride channel protein [Pseudomonadota bacterium]
MGLGYRDFAHGAAKKLAARAQAALLSQTRSLFRVQGRLRSNEPVQILVCAATGAVIGAMIAGLHKLVDLLHELAFNIQGGHTLSTGIGLDTQRILIVPVAGGLLLGLSALIMRYFRAREIVDPIEANALHGGRMSIKDSSRLVFDTLLSNASGVAVGMEAGYSQLGAAVLSKVGQYFRLRRADQRIFVAAGAAAAIAAAFNAPVAGAFYGFELILGSYAVPALAPIAAAAMAGTLMDRALVHPESLFVVQQIFEFNQWIYLVFALLGLFAAGFSILTMQSVTWVERGLRKLPLPQWLRPAVGGVLVTGLALMVPQVLGSGHGAIQLVFDRDPALTTLFILLIGKLIASALSLGAGYRGGMFSSSLFLGCLFGATFADIVSFAVPSLAIHHAALMMVGMGSVAAAIIGAPLTMVFLVLEGTGNFPMTIGVMTGVIVSSTIVRLVFGYSFSTWRFHQRGIGIRGAHDIGWLADLTVGRLMRADPKLVQEGMSVREVRAKFPSGTAKRVFVVGEGGVFLGQLDLSIHEAKHDEVLDTKFARDFAINDDLYLLAYENVRTALTRFEEKEVEALPVLDSTVDKTIVGYMTEQYALRRYNQELERRRSADLGERDLFSISEPPAR